MTVYEALVAFCVPHMGCRVCGRLFSVADWENRHTAPDGDDIHAECCGCLPVVELAPTGEYTT